MDENKEVLETKIEDVEDLSGIVTLPGIAYRGKLNEEQTNRIKDEILFEKFSTFIKKKNTKKETKEKKEEVKE